TPVVAPRIEINPALAIWARWVVTDWVDVPLGRLERDQRPIDPVPPTQFRRPSSADPVPPTQFRRPSSADPVPPTQFRRPHSDARRHRRGGGTVAGDRGHAAR